MKNLLSPRFDEQFYKGQDVVHQGVRIPLNGLTPESIFRKFSRNAQGWINKGKKEKRYIFTDTLSSDLEKLRELWFDPDDETFPKVMDVHDHFGITASDESLNISGAILLRVQGNNLFLHQLVSSPQGKKDGLPTILIWEAVKKFIFQYHSIDIGVSYNPKRQKFFEHFAVERYPIILKPPFYTPIIRLTPFRVMADPAEKLLHPVQYEGYTILPRASYALYALLKHLKIGEGDMVCIVKTFGSSYLSRCVTDAIEKTGATWKVNDLIREGTKIVLVVHEFGIPVFQFDHLDKIKQAIQIGIPVVEDCAWTNKSFVEESNYQIFSLSKVYPIQYGGLLHGVQLDNDFLWSIGCLDTVKQEYIKSFPHTEAEETTRRNNWLQYYNLCKADGMEMDDCYDYYKAVLDKHWMPTMFFHKLKSESEATALVTHLAEFGIEAGQYWGEPLVFVPIHQNMTPGEVEYMFAAVRGFFNLCHAYAGSTLSGNVN